jgi:RNA polymerase sigma factor (sigma-70 family)
MTKPIAPQQRMTQLYRRLSPILRARARRVLKDEFLAEDAAHEVFIRVIRHLDDLPDDEGVSAWLQRICVNYCLNVLRSQKTHQKNVEPVEDLYEGGESAYVNRQFAERALKRSAPNVAIAAKLYYLDGMEQQKVAEALKVTRRTVCSRLEQFLNNARELHQQEESVFDVALKVA